MTFRGFAVFAVVSGSAVVAGWSALGFVGLPLTGGVTQIVNEAPAARVAATFASASLSSEPKARMLKKAPVRTAALYDASFLSPQMMSEPRKPVAPIAASSAPSDGPVGLPRAVSRELANAEDAESRALSETVRLAYAGEPDALVVPKPRPAPTPQVKVSVDDQKALKAAASRWENGGPLTPHEISRIRAALHLTADQEAGWKDVEAVLVEIGKQQVAAQKAGKARPTLGADVTQKLYWAAGPLLMSLREDQKREIRRMARVMGLETVASLI